MSGHSRWSEIRRRVDIAQEAGVGHMLQDTASFFQGYILALEDVLLDIDRIYRLDAHDVADRLIERVQETLQQANRTLENLK